MQNAGEMVREFQKRASSAGLRVEVPSFGNFNADIAVIGEYPGERELFMKMPFVGQSGKLLFDVLGKQGITRQHVWTTNVVRCRIGEAGEKKTIHKGDLAQWYGLLEWELSQLPNLKYILVLGNLPLEGITGETGITHWRGSVVDWSIRSTDDRPPRTVKLICANNPALVLREPKNEIVFHFDMNKLKLVREGKWKPHVIKPIINPSPREAIAFITRMQDEKLPTAFDIETISNEAACVGFANSPHEGMCINFRDRTTNRWKTIEERAVRKRINRFLTDPNARIVAQNGTFDSYWLWYKDRIRVHKVWFDTLLAHHTLYSQLPHNLGFLTAQYTTHPYYKDEKRDWREGGNIDSFWEYNVKDCCITLACQRALLGELQAQNLDKFFFNHVMRLQPHLIRMTVGGMLTDRALKDKIVEELGEEVAEQERYFKNCACIATGEPDLDVNPLSAPQLADLFFRRLKLVGRGVSTDADNRQRMLSHPRTSQAAKDVILSLDKFKEDQKFLSTYAESIIDEDGRSRSEWKQYGTQSAPGRLSSTAVMWGSGGNFQNQPERSKKMYIADKGYRYLYFDLSQAEARIVAYAWNVRGLIENFEAAAKDKSLDVHRANASRIFKVPYDTIPKFDRYLLGENTDDPKLDNRPTKRFLGKRCVHGLNYRMQAPKLAQVCNIPMLMAQEAFISYHKAFPEIKDGWEATTKEVYRTRELWNFMGRRLKFLGRLPTPGAEVGEEASVLESIIAFKPQSTIGDKVCETIYLCEDDPDWPKDARVVLNIHDALIALVPDDDEVATYVAKIMRKHAEAPILVNGTPVVIPADFAWSVPDENGVHRWSNMKKFKLAA